MKKLIQLFIIGLFFPLVAHAQLQVEKDATTFHFQVVARTTAGVEKTDVSSWTCYRTINGASGAACTGTATEIDDTNLPGMWDYVPSAAETATVGTVAYRFSATDTAPFQKEIQVGGVSLADNTIKPTTYQPRGTAQTATSTTIQLAASESFASNDLANTCVYIVSASTGAGQTRPILSYDGGTDTATVAAWGTLPTGTIVYDLFPCTSGGSSSRGQW